MVPMSWLVDPFHAEFMQRALLAGMLAVLASAVTRWPTA
jgi:ABC-type Mn2+/Zn2+ transport system permease subunit